MEEKEKKKQTGDMAVKYCLYVRAHPRRWQEMESGCLSPLNLTLPGRLHTSSRTVLIPCAAIFDAPAKVSKL
jgi:hypothetical protein